MTFNVTKCNIFKGGGGKDFSDESKIKKPPPCINVF